MKKTLLLLCSLFFTFQVFSQCEELFFSEYVEGYANNKALEIYNPTENAIDLSNYSIVRFSNGSTTADALYTVTLPGDMIEAHGTYVIVVDLTDTADWNTQFDKPAWNGYNVVDTLFDVVTGLPILDEDGNVVFGPQYIDGAAIFGSEYNEEYDLQGKADVFLCPDYDTNRTMYFNGNDAMALISGTEVAVDGSNLIDVIGVIGENPEETIMEDAWVDADGFWLTKDRTLVRNYDIEKGRNALSDVVLIAGGTFTGTEWTSYFKNDFSHLGAHESACQTSSISDLNEVAFEMFPNPNSSDILNISSEEKISKIIVYDLLGEMVMTNSLSQPLNKMNLDISTLENGMFVISLLFDANQVSNKTLVIQK